MPHIGIKFTAREKIDRRTFCHCDICDYEAGMVGGHIIVERIRKDSIFVIEKEDEGEGEDVMVSLVSCC